MSEKLHYIESKKGQIGLNFNQLGESMFFEELYKNVKELSKGATQKVYGNDIEQKFHQAIVLLKPNQEQTEILHEFQLAFINLQDTIDPNRLVFSFSKTPDDEICIYKSANSGGVVNLIIHEDGLIALSFVAYKNNEHKNSGLRFFDDGKYDFEKIMYDFFSF